MGTMTEEELAAWLQERRWRIMEDPQPVARELLALLDKDSAKEKTT